MMKYIGQDGYVHILGESELMHYNHNHDKLGRFASSGGSAGSAQRGLRKLEVHRIKTLGREMKADYKYRKAYKKADSKLDKAARYYMREDANAKKAERLKKSAFDSMTKAAKLDAKRNTYETNRKETEAFINKAISNAEKNGYAVSSVAKTRSSQRGKDFVNMYAGAELAGPIGAAVAVTVKNKKQQKKYGRAYNNQTPSRINTNKYKVRKPKKSK